MEYGRGHGPVGWTCVEPAVSVGRCFFCVQIWGKLGNECGPYFWCCQHVHGKLNWHTCWGCKAQFWRDGPGNQSRLEGEANLLWWHGAMDNVQPQRTVVFLSYVLSCLWWPLMLMMFMMIVLAVGLSLSLPLSLPLFPSMAFIIAVLLLVLVQVSKHHIWGLQMFVFCSLLLFSCRFVVEASEAHCSGVVCIVELALLLLGCWSFVPADFIVIMSGTIIFISSSYIIAITIIATPALVRVKL